jgi:hypothetical protein
MASCPTIRTENGFTIRVILARDLQYGGESSLVPINNGSDLVRDLEDEEDGTDQPSLPFRVNRRTGGDLGSRVG